MTIVPLLGRPWGLLGTPSSAQLRSYSLSWFRLASFWAFLHLSGPNFNFPSLGTLPEPRKSTKNRWFSLFFYYFHKLLEIAENPSKMLPKCSWKASKTPLNPPRSSQDTPRCGEDVSKMPSDTPRRTQSLAQTRPRFAQDAPRLHKTPRDSPKDAPKTPPKLAF